MTINRRRSGLALLALAAVAAAPWKGALAARKPAQDDDDDTPNLPNTFYSPAGKPFRAAAGEPYPVVDWFKEADKNGDGKIDRAEFLADAEAFFNLLDINKDGYLSRYEITIYEHKIAPEILVGTAHIGLGPDGDGTGRGGARLWLAQGGVQRPGPIDPGGDNQEAPSGKPPTLDESGQGASPYGFFEEPEPVMSADLNVNGIISKANFLKTADMHFDALDQRKLGYLTLATLPKTPIQRALDHARKGRKRA
jgi:hypothetical protein